MRVLLLPLAAALLLGCSAEDFKVPSASNGSASLPSADYIVNYGTEMMMVFNNLCQFAQLFIFTFLFVQTFFSLQFPHLQLSVPAVPRLAVVLQL